MPHDKEVHELLKRAKKVIATKDRWHRGALVDEKGGCYCALGAVLKGNGVEVRRGMDFPGDPGVDGFDPDQAIHAAVVQLAEHSTLDRWNPSTAVWETNDCLGFEAVHEMFDKAIEATA